MSSVGIQCFKDQPIWVGSVFLFITHDRNVHLGSNDDIKNPFTLSVQETLISNRKSCFRMIDS